MFSEKKLFFEKNIKSGNKFIEYKLYEVLHSTGPFIM